MVRKISNIYCLVVLMMIVCSVNVWAQNPPIDVPAPVEDVPDIDPENIDIVKPYEPVLADAVKVSLSPILPTKEELDSQKPAFNDYSVPNRYLTMTYDPPTLKPKRYKSKKTELEKLHHAWLRAGYGNINTPLIDGSFSTGRSKDYVVGGNAYYHSSNSKKIDYQDFSNLGAELYGKVFQKTTYTTFNGGYKRDTYHYYGYDEDSLIVAYDTQEEARQIFQTISAGAELGTSKENNLELDYKMRFDFHRFADNHDGAENNVIIGGDMNKQYSETISFGGFVHAHYSTYKREPNSFDDMAFNLTPTFTFQEFYGKFTLGASLLFDDGNFHPFPYLEVEGYLVEDRLTLYGGWDKDLIKNNYMQFADANPFISHFLDYRNTVRESRYAGVRGSIMPAVSYNAKVVQRVHKNQPYFINDSLDRKQFNVVYDSTMISLGGMVELGLQFAKDAEIIVGVEYQNYETKQQEEAWHLPKLKSTISGVFTGIDKLNVRADVYFAQGAKAWLPNEVVSLKPIVDVNFAVRYSVIDNISLFANVNNVTSLKYQRYLYYPNYGFNALGGFIVKF